MASARDGDNVALVGRVGSARSRGWVGTADSLEDRNEWVGSARALKLVHAGPGIVGSHAGTGREAPYGQSDGSIVIGIANTCYRVGFFENLHNW